MEVIMKKLIFTFCFLFPIFSFSQIIHIPSDYPTIQEGINASENGDTVLVDTGTYFENINFNGKSITVTSNYLTTLDTSFISQTIIDGNGIGTVVIFENGEDSTTCLCGFTIANGLASCMSISNNSGGGIYCYDGSPKLTHLHVFQNISVIDGWKNNSEDCPHGLGGGLYFENSNSLIRDLVISSNHAHVGGGICCKNSNITIEKTSIFNNVTDNPFPRGGGRGAGIAIIESEIVIINSTIDSNNAYGNSRGGGIDSEVSITKLINVSLNNNYSQAAGDGIWCYGGEMDLFNVLLENHNQAFEARYATVVFNNGLLINNDIGIFLGHQATILVQNSIMWNNYSFEIRVRPNFYGNDITVLHSDIDGGQSNISLSNGGTLNWLEGNINEDPQFEGFGDHPFQLSAGSPCIDAGTPDTTGLNLPQLDIIGNKRIWDGDNNGSAIIDMGVYEFGSIPVGLKDPIVQSPSLDIQSYPNPFISATVITFTIYQNSQTMLNVYDLNGQLVSELVNEIYPIGKYEVVYRETSLPPGIYFCVLKTSEGIQTTKMIKF